MTRSSRARVSLVLFAMSLLAACTDAPPAPAPLDVKNEQCARCRMSVSDRRFAAQLTAPGVEPVFFDDAGCLRDWLRKPKENAHFTAWVSDHRTKAFVAAATAVYAKSPTVQTPMSSGILAWADAASREADPSAKDATPLAAADVIGPLLAARSR